METLHLKEKLQLTENYYAFFRNIIHRYPLEEIVKELDPITIDSYFKEKGIEYRSYIYYACLLEREDIKNQALSYLLSKEEYVALFLNRIDGFYSMFSGFELPRLEELIQKISTQKLSSSDHFTYHFFSSIESEKQYQLLRKIEKEDVLEKIFPYACKQTKEQFLKEDPRAYTLLEENKISAFTLIDDHVKIPFEILKSNLFFEKIKGKSLIGMRNTINKVEEDNFTLIVEEKLEAYEASMIEEYHPQTNLFSCYENVTRANLENHILESKNPYLLSIYFYHQLLKPCSEEQFQIFLKEETSRKLSEIILDYLFKDNYYNVRYNLEELIRYAKQVKPGLLTEEELQQYQLFLNIDSLSNEQKIELFHTYKDAHLSISFYEDLKKHKLHAYHQIIESLYQPTEPICTLKGEPFTMIVRGMIPYNPHFSNQRRGCYSLIGTNNIEVMPGHEFYYGYANVDENRIAHMFENDAYSSDTKSEQTHAINRIMTKEELQNVKGYNEIQIINEKRDNHYDPLKPSYLVVFDQIEEKHQEEAKRLQIPIVVIESKKYPTKATEPSHMFQTSMKEGYRYIRHTYDEEKMRGF